jgi:hypothetical protein
MEIEDSLSTQAFFQWKRGLIVHVAFSFVASELPGPSIQG